MKKNRILVLALAFVMGLMAVAPAFAKVYDKDILAKTAGFILRYDAAKDLGEPQLKAWLEEELSGFAYKGGRSEVSPLTQTIIDQNVEDFIILYDELMSREIKVSEKLEILADTLDQFNIVEVKHNLSKY